MENLWAAFKDRRNVTLLQQKVLLIGHGHRLSFYSLDTASESLHYLADGRDNGDGVACVIGHSFVPIFAFAELVASPRILVKSYPDLRPVAVLTKPVTEDSYLSLSFSATDHLVALTGFNTFRLEVWNWRSSALLATQTTNFSSIHQTVRCTLSTQLMVIQWATNLKSLAVWSVNLGTDAAKLVPIDLSCNNATDWNVQVAGYAVFREDQLIIHDAKGSLYLASLGRRTVQRMAQVGSPVTAISSAFNDNGLLCATSSDLYQFKVNCDHFQEMAHVTLTSPFQYFGSQSDTNILIGMTVDGCLNRINITNIIELEAIKSFYINHKLLALLPGDTLLIVTIEDVLELYEVRTQRKISTIAACCLENVTAVAFYEPQSCLLLGSNRSRMRVYHYYEQGLVRLVAELYFSDSGIESIKVTDHFIVVEDSGGTFFVVSGESFAILKYVQIDGNIMECIPVERSGDRLWLICCYRSAKSDYFSEHVEVLSLNMKDGPTERYSHKLRTPWASISSLDHPGRLAVNPYLSRDLEILQVDVRATKIEIGSIRYIKNVNQLKYVQTVTKGRYILAFGLDGVVSVIDAEDGQLLASTIVSHRLLAGGTGQIHISPTMNCYLFVDSFGNMVCNKLPPLLSMSKALPLVVRLPPLLERSVDSPTISYLESWQNRTLQSEQQNSEQIRKAMLAQIQILRDQVKVLLNENETKPEGERLPIQAFNLNESSNEVLHQEATSDETREEMRRFIQSQEAIRDWLLTTCWNVMDVHGTTIRGFFWDIKVENFALRNDEPITEADLRRAKMLFQIERLANRDAFLPWAPIDTNRLEEILGQDPSICKPKDVLVETKSAPHISGTVTVNLIETLLPRYGQLEVVTYQQMHLEEIFGHFDMLSLKEHFNARFNDLKEIKLRETAVIKQRNDRLRFIQDELNALEALKESRYKHTDDIIDPEFELDETPERIQLVSDDEIPVKQYQSVSGRARQSDEDSEEEIQEELFSAAFREKSLQTMMDGVLEIRWEDEIKKRPAVPIALQARKELKDYDEHDFRAVREYEEKLRFLGAERDKYKQMLLAERQEIIRCRHDRIMDFNWKLSQLIDFKINVQMAVLQENIKLLRNREFNAKRVLYAANEHQVKLKIGAVKKEIVHLTTAIHDFGEKIGECKLACDTLEARDRLMDKQFKNNFAEVSSHAIVDHAYKFFKRRPRWIAKSWATAEILSDMARRIITKNSDPLGAPLQQDCFDFLHTIDQLDQATNCPSIMDDRLWQMLCRMRRAKIESEFKVRSLSAHLVESERTIESLTKEISFRKVALVNLDRQMMGVREKKVSNLINRTVQLVLKRGTLEVDLTGQLSDFVDTILIAKAEVDEVNKSIRKAGAKKLAAMNNAAIFKRKVLQKQWEHQVLQMKIKDMRNFVRIVEKSKITKDVQLWLDKKRKGCVTEDVSQVALNNEIEAMVSVCDKEFMDLDNQLKSICRKMRVQRIKNDRLDEEIEALNLDVNEQHQLHDADLEDQINNEQEKRLQMIAKRSKLLKRVQMQHVQIVELSRLLEVQRLRTYPTLNEVYH